MTVKAKCSVCGEEVELQDNLKSFVERYPERVKCKKCYSAGGTDAKKATTKAKEVKTEAKGKGGEVTAELLRKSYDEVKAAFADVIDEVHDFIGPWTTSVAIGKSKS